MKTFETARSSDGLVLLLIALQWNTLLFNKSWKLYFFSISIFIHLWYFCASKNELLSLTFVRNTNQIYDGGRVETKFQVGDLGCQRNILEWKSSVV